MQTLCLKNVAQVGASFDRGIMGVCDDLDLPRFQRARREKFNTKLHGREQEMKEKKLQSLSTSQRRDKPQRKLVILSSKSERLAAEPAP